MHACCQILKHNDDKCFLVQGGGKKDLEESIQELPTRRISLEAPKVEDGNVVNGGLQGGTENDGV